MKRAEDSFKTLRDWERYANQPFRPVDYGKIDDFTEIVDDRLPLKPDVSIVVVTYNHEKYLEQCLQSLLCQKTSFSYEIVLSEDCSTDGTRDICLRYQREYPDKIHLLLSNTNCGAIVNSRRARRVARSELLCWCEGDDYWIYDHKIEDQVSFMKANEKIVFHGGSKRMVFLDESRTEKDEDVTGRGKAFLCHLSACTYRFCHLSTWCVRRSFFTEIDPVLDSIGYSRDEILLILAEGLYGVYLVPDVYSVHIVTGSGIWSSLSYGKIQAEILKGRLRNVGRLPVALSCFSLRLLARTYQEWIVYFYRRKDFESCFMSALKWFWYNIRCLMPSSRV